MSAKTDLQELYRQKKEKEGLVDVKFVFTENAKEASVEELCQEVLNLEKAINDGRFTKILDFGDSRRKRAHE